MTGDALREPAAIRDMFARIRGRYDLLNRLLSLGSDVRWRRRMARLVASKHPRRILDLATGSGDVWLELRRAVPHAEIICGADFCSPLLEMARRKGAGPLVVADALRLPFADGVFDAITIAFGVRNFADRATAFRECLRVLSPGGTLWILEFTPPPRALAAPYFFYVGKVGPIIARVVGAEAGAYRYLGESIRHFPGATDLASELGDAGFTGADFQRFSFGTVCLHWAASPPLVSVPQAAGSR